MPLQTLLTFDTEIWCDGWDNLDAKFPRAFERYIYGKSGAGSYALPKTLELLNQYQLKGVFFVEPLFAARFGIEYLSEIIQLIHAAGQDIQLHLHPEWQNEARNKILKDVSDKKPGLSYFSLAEQTQLIQHAIGLLIEAGAKRPIAFRSGGFYSNMDTWHALESNTIKYDSSLNLLHQRSGINLPTHLRRSEMHHIGNVFELPQSVFLNASGKLRHLQIGSCSFSEMTQTLHHAHLSGWKCINFLSHNFELLLRNSNKPDWIVVRRFEQLCNFLAQNRETYTTVNFADHIFEEESANLPIPHTNMIANARRFAEQGYRRILEGLA